MWWDVMRSDDGADLGSAEKEMVLLLCLFLDLKELAMLKYIQEGSSEELNLYSELNPDCNLMRVNLFTSYYTFCIVHFTVLLMISDALVQMSVCVCVCVTAAHLRALMLLSLYVPLRIASSISCIFFKLSSPSACEYRSKCPQTVSPFSATQQTPTEGTADFRLTELNNGTAACADNVPGWRRNHRVSSVFHKHQLDSGFRGTAMEISSRRRRRRGRVPYCC